MNVFVLDGNFLNKIEKFEKGLEDRITDEDFYLMIDNYSLGKLDGDWKKKLNESKSLLALGLNFDNINKLIENARFFVEQVLTKPSQKEIALRCFYHICSFIAINIDYLQRELLFLEDGNARKSAFKEGFKYGSKGEKEIKQIIDMSLSFVEQYSEHGKSTANQARYNIHKQLDEIQTDILADYFSSFEVLQNIFKTGIDFESIAMKKIFVSHLGSSVEIKSFVGALLDYFCIDRVKFSEAVKSTLAV